jgi:hypothetical protein
VHRGDARARRAGAARDDGDARGTCTRNTTSIESPISTKIKIYVPIDLAPTHHAPRTLSSVSFSSDFPLRTSSPWAAHAMAFELTVPALSPSRLYTADFSKKSWSRTEPSAEHVTAPAP